VRAELLASDKECAENVTIVDLVRNDIGRSSTVRTGGGITAPSVPQEELEEVRLKAAVLLAVLGAWNRAYTRSN